MKISIVIPVYNAEKYICRCLDSVRNQTYMDWEVIAINDGSQDNSYSILREYAFNDKRFKVSSHDNQGPGYTRNIAILQATGNYIVFLDADDYIDVNYLENLAICATENNADVIFVDVRQEKPNGKLIKIETISKYKGCSKDKIIRYQLTGKLPWGGCRKAVRASLLSNYDIKYSHDIVGEEALFSFIVLFHAKVISFLDKPYYHYINYPNSQSKQGDIDPWGVVCNKVKSYLNKNGLLDEYRNALNSFAYTALIVSIYRRTQIYSMKEALKQSKYAFEKFKEIYDLKLDKDCLEIRTKCVLPFIRLGMLFPIVIAAKINQVLNNRKWT